MSGKHANVELTLEQVINYNFISLKFSKCLYVRIILYLENKRTFMLSSNQVVRVQVHVHVIK
jgi:hypothetical protein